MKIDGVAIAKGEAAEAVPIGLVLPRGTFGDGADGKGLHWADGGLSFRGMWRNRGPGAG